MTEISRTEATKQLIDIGKRADARGWVPATGGNFSCRLDDDSILVTVSGRHKGQLLDDDFVRVDLAGQPLEGGRPSYETLQHCERYRSDPDIGCVLHTHSVAGTVLSKRGDDIVLSNYELLKILPGISTHETSVRVPVFPNDQNILRMSQRVANVDNLPGGYLVAGHGLYAWGGSPDEAFWRVEALEFLFACEME